ncbi:CHAT domain-containing protein [Mycena galopus ATCC 62051]|nr:CHAT domain-containing protein [Mycena galopus ATCC 62051]
MIAEYSVDTSTPLLPKSDSNDMDKVFNNFFSGHLEGIWIYQNTINYWEQLFATDIKPQGIARYLADLSICLTDRYRRSENLVDLDTSMLNAIEAEDLAAEGHPDRAAVLQSLTVSLNLHYERLGDAEDLHDALQSGQEAVSLMPVGHPDRAECLNIMAAVLTNQYKRFGDLKDLEAAQQKKREAMGLMQELHSHRAAHLKSLALSFADQYQNLGDLQDPKDALKCDQETVNETPDGHPARARMQSLAALETALIYEQEAVNLTPEGHPARPELLRNLAILFIDRYTQFGDLQNIQTALECCQEAVNLTPEGHPDRPVHLQGLAMAFKYRYKGLNNLQDLEAELQNYQEAVSLIPEGHPDRAQSLDSLAVAFRTRYQQLGELEDLEAALQNTEKAVDLTPKGHPARAWRLVNLQGLITQRYLQLGNMQDLEAALWYGTEAMDLTQTHPDRALCLHNLAASLGHRFERLGALQDLKTAIQKQQEVIDLTPDDHPDKARMLDNLGVFYMNQYKRVGALQDLEVALQMKTKAMNLAPEEHPDKAGHLQNLAISLLAQYRRLGDLQDFEAALQCGQKAVELTPVGSPERAGRLHTVSVSLTDRFVKFQDPQDLEAALQNEHDALDGMPEGHPEKQKHLQGIAALFRYCYLITGNPEDLIAVHAHYTESFQCKTSLTPETSWKEALYWGYLAEAESDPTHCETAFTAAFQHLPDILWIGHSIPVRQEALYRLDVSQATSTATRALIHFSKLTSAVEIIEQGLATTFQQMLQLRTDTDGLKPAQAEELERLSFQLYSGTYTDVMTIVDKRNKLLEEIRKQPGLEYFLCPKPYSALSYASQGGPVVILNSHKSNCDGIILPDPTSEPVHVPLPSIKLDMLQSQQVILKQLLGPLNVRIRGESDSSRLFGAHEQFTSKPSKECFADLLTWLWVHIVGPVYQVLDSLGIHNGRIWWLPMGAFTGLPFHACPPTDTFIHSYTATLGSLLDAYTKKPSGTQDRFGIVGVTQTGPGENYLGGVEQEVRKIQSIIKSCPVKCLDGHQATVDAVKLQLQDCSWMHLACHGKQDSLDATKSCLRLYRGDLELDTILRMPLSNAQVVFLSACETAMGDAELVNESFHLGGGFITAGFRGAIGTLACLFSSFP